MATDVETQATDETEATDYSKAEQQHYAEICEANRQVAKLQAAFEAKKEKAKSAKAQYEEAQAELSALIGRGPNPQLKLPGMDGTEEPWRAVLLTEAGLTERQCKLLADNEPSIKTLGDLTDWEKATDSSSPLTLIKGIGTTASEDILKRLDEWWGLHPEMVGRDAVPEEDEEGDDDE